MKVNIQDLSGIVVISDFENRLNLDPVEEADIESILPKEAKEGRLFYYDAEDPIEENLLFELVTAFPSEQGYDHRYTLEGGNYLLEVPSGRITISGLTDWACPEKPVHDFYVEPGTYVIQPFCGNDFATTSHDEEMSRLVGEEEYRYYKKVSNLSCLGCLPTLAAFAVAFFSIKYAVYVLGIAAVCWLPHAIGRLSKRYRGLERKIEEYESEFPLFVFVLSRIQDSKGLVGGFIKP